MVRRVLAAIALAGFTVCAAAAPALADTPPGPGSTQCVPGQNPQPGPGQVGGTCPAH